MADGADLLAREKLRIFTMDLTDEELALVSRCRTGIIVASVAGGAFGIVGGRAALGSTPSPFIIRALVLSACVTAGVFIGAGVAVQHSYHHLKSTSTSLADELKKYTALKKAIYKNQCVCEQEVNSQLSDDLFNKRLKKPPQAQSNDSI